MQTNASGATAWVIVYKNMANPALAGVSSGVATANAFPFFTPPNLTTTAANTTVISLLGINAARPLSLSSAQGFGLEASLQDTTGSGDRTLGVADRFAAAAGAVTSPTWSQGLLLSQWAYITVAFTS